MLPEPEARGAFPEAKRPEATASLSGERIPRLYHAFSPLALSFSKWSEGRPSCWVLRREGRPAATGGGG